MNNPQIEMVNLAGLTAYEKNSRTHSPEQIMQIEASIREFGFTNPVLIDDSGGIIAGHGRVMAARNMGLEAVPCLRLSHLSEEQKRAYIIADNKLADNAGWDMALLRLEIGELAALEFNLDLLGFDSKALDAMLAFIDETKGLTDPDDIPDLPNEPVTQPGDLWCLGHHRLLCGDSTSIDCVQQLLGGSTADMVFTDPPYNVNYKGGTKDKLTIKNDKMKSADFYRFLYDAFVAAATVVQAGAPIYVCHSDSEGINFRKSLIDSGWLIKTCLIWVKNHFILGRMDYHMQHEPILYGWRAGGPHRWYGGRRQSTIIEQMPGLVIKPSEDGAEISISDGLRCCTLRVPSYEVVGASYGFDSTIWKVNKPIKNPDHPTPKPVEIPRRAIENSSINGNRVFDPFLGSGSTLIACEQSGRICYGMELDPKYCDVIIKRWEQFTGRKAEIGNDVDDPMVAQAQSEGGR